MLINTRMIEHALLNRNTAEYVNGSIVTNGHSYKVSSADIEIYDTHFLVPDKLARNNNMYTNRDAYHIQHNLTDREMKEKYGYGMFDLTLERSLEQLNNSDAIKVNPHYHEEV